MYYTNAGDILCCLSGDLYHSDCGGERFDSSTPNTDPVQTFVKDKNINISIFGSLAVVPKHGLVMGPILKRGTVVVHKKLHACMGSTTSTRCLS